MVRDSVALGGEPYDVCFTSDDATSSTIVGCNEGSLCRFLLPWQESDMPYNSLRVARRSPGYTGHKYQIRNLGDREWCTLQPEVNTRNSGLLFKHAIASN